MYHFLMQYNNNNLIVIVLYMLIYFSLYKGEWERLSLWHKRTNLKCQGYVIGWLLLLYDELFIL